MWVFGYGSLMWGDWKDKFDGLRTDGARLSEYHRSFNKASKQNWGTEGEPGPTLGLEPEAQSECVGCAFEIPDEHEQAVAASLREREGPSFTLQRLDIVLPDGRVESALVPVNDRGRRTYLGDRPISERAAMARSAVGDFGNARDYVTNTRQKLNEMGVQDPHVEEFFEAVHAEGEA